MLIEYRTIEHRPSVEVSHGVVDRISADCVKKGEITEVSRGVVISAD